MGCHKYLSSAESPLHSSSLCQNPTSARVLWKAVGAPKSCSWGKGQPGAGHKICAFWKPLSVAIWYHRTWSFTDANIAWRGWRSLTPWGIPRLPMEALGQVGYRNFLSSESCQVCPPSSTQMWTPGKAQTPGPGLGTAPLVKVFHQGQPEHLNVHRKENPASTNFHCPQSQG